MSTSAGGGCFLKELELTREDLYNRIWQQPLREIAKELFMSDVGLGKLCKRNGIPTPPQGYHLMNAGFKKDKLKIRLPPPKPGQYLTFKFRQDSTLPTKTVVADIDKQTFEALFALRPETPGFEQSRLIKQCIKNVRGRVQKTKTDVRGIILTPDIHYPVRVAPDLLDRACDILKELLSIFSTIGAEIQNSLTNANNKYTLGVLWQGYDFSFRIEERSKRVPPTEKHRKQQTHWYRGKDWIFEPTGRLELEIRGPDYTTTTIRDGKRSIEERMFEIVETLYIKVVKQQREDAIRKERKIKAITRLKELDKIRQEQEFLSAKQKQLAKEARLWRKTTYLREYITKIEENGFQASKNSLPHETAWNEWIRWAKEYIDY